MFNKSLLTSRLIGLRAWSKKRAKLKDNGHGERGIGLKKSTNKKRNHPQAVKRIRQITPNRKESHLEELRSIKKSQQRKLKRMYPQPTIKD